MLVKIAIEIPVEIDGALTSSERRQLKEHIEQGIQRTLQVLTNHFDREPRMLSTTCRFRFGELKATVE